MKSVRIIRLVNTIIIHVTNFHMQESKNIKIINCDNLSVNILIYQDMIIQSVSKVFIHFGKYITRIL